MTLGIGNIVTAIVLLVSAGQDIDLKSSVRQKLDDLLAVSISGASSARKAHAYRALFKQITPAELNKLTAHSDLSLALQARFEQLCIPEPPNLKLQNGDIVVPVPNVQFETFFARRTGYAPPTWWARGFRVPPGSEFGRGYNSGGLADRSVLPKGLWRKNSGDTITVGDASRRITFQRHGSGDALYVLFNGSSTYVECYDSAVAYPSTLTAYETSSGKRVWEQQVWGNYRGGFAGYGVHDLAVEIHNGEIIVYGVGPGSYAEGFRQSDGKPVFRFSTNYWSQYEER